PGQTAVPDPCHVHRGPQNRSLCRDNLFRQGSSGPGPHLSGPASTGVRPLTRPVWSTPDTARLVKAAAGWPNKPTRGRVARSEMGRARFEVFASRPTLAVLAAVAIVAA